LSSISLVNRCASAKSGIFARVLVSAGLRRSPTAREYLPRQHPCAIPRLTNLRASPRRRRWSKAFAVGMNSKQSVRVAEMPSEELLRDAERCLSLIVPLLNLSQAQYLSSYQRLLSSNPPTGSCLRAGPLKNNKEGRLLLDCNCDNSWPRFRARLLRWVLERRPSYRNNRLHGQGSSVLFQARCPKAFEHSRLLLTALAARSHGLRLEKAKRESPRNDITRPRQRSHCGERGQESGGPNPPPPPTRHWRPERRFRRPRRPNVGQPSAARRLLKAMTPYAR